MTSEKVEDLNELGAKLIKAELMGDDDLVASLKIRLENARKLSEGLKPEPKQTYHRPNKPQSHHKHRSKRNDEETTFKRNYKYDEYDDLTFNDFEDSSSKKFKKKDFVGQSEKDQKEEAKSSDNCDQCYENSQKHLVVSIGKHCYLSLPSSESLVDGHCQIIPMSHCSSSVTCDEEVWSAIQDYKKALVRMFDKKRMECVFYELYTSENKNNHMVLECIPLGMDVSNLAPIYFKKAIVESESEWSTNKKIVELKDQTVREKIPKNMPYFTVGFGMENGFAHVIEKSEAYPKHFAKEVIGGIIDLDPLKWMRPRKENFNEQSKKVIEFLKWWKQFDFNKN